MRSSKQPRCVGGLGFDLRPLVYCVALASIGGAAGCAASESHESSAGKGSANFGGSSGGGNSKKDGDFGAAPSGESASGGRGNDGGAGGAFLPPETENRVDFESPQAGARFVFVANPRRDSVAAIDSTNLTIRTIEVGDAPSYLATVPGQDIALVINIGSQDLSIVRTDVATSTVSNVGVVPGVNRVSVAPGGQHALAWYDASRDNGFGVTGSFQDLSMIRLSPQGDVAIPLTVGFKPEEVFFSNDGQSAFVVTEDGISVVRFAAITGPTLVPLLPLTMSAQGQSRDVSVTPDGRYALARQEGKSEIILMDLTTGTSTSLDMKSPVTDLDLGPDGTWALAVMRDKNTYARINLPGGFLMPDSVTPIEVPGEKIGLATISPDGARAVLFSTAGGVERVVIVSTDGSTPPRGVRMRKLVRGVAMAPDSKSAIVLHDRDLQTKEMDKGEALIDRAFGYSVISLESGFAKLQLTDADPGPMAITPDSTRAFLLLRNDGQSLRLAQRVDLRNFLIDDFGLGSPPLSVSALATASQQVFVSQEHPSGRISFINWESGDMKSVTGFELNGGIIQ